MTVAHFFEAIGVVTSVFVICAIVIGLMAWGFYPLDKGDRG